MDRENVIYTYNALFSLAEEGNSGTCYNTDEIEDSGLSVIN